MHIKQKRDIIKSKRAYDFNSDSIKKGVARGGKIICKESKINSKKGK